MKQTALKNLQIAKPYAKTLFDLATESGSLNEVEVSFAALSSFFKENPSLLKNISSPLYDKLKQIAFIDKLLSDRLLSCPDAARELLIKFCKILIKNSRLNLLPLIYSAFQQLCAEMRQQVFATVTTAQQLTEQQFIEIKSALDKLLNKEVVLQKQLNEKLIGGFVVDFGSSQIDTSILTKLTSLKHVLKEVS